MNGLITGTEEGEDFDVPVSYETNRLQRLWITLQQTLCLPSILTVSFVDSHSDDPRSEYDVP